MPNPTKTNPRYNHFGSWPHDANRQPISVSENYFGTEDATGTPVTSPATISNTGVSALTVPAAAGSIVISSSAALRVSEDSTMSHYFVLPANTPLEFPCLSPAADQQLTNTGVIYLQGDAASCTVQFFFKCV